MAKCNKCGAEVLEGALFCTECGEALTQPFEPGSKPSSNPFSEMEQNVPKPEVSSTLIFEDPIQDYKEEQKAENWGNQSNYGKPQFDADAGSSPSSEGHADGTNAGGGNAGHTGAFGAFAAGASGNTAGNAAPPPPNNDWEKTGNQAQYQSTGGATYNTGYYSESDAQGNDKLWAILSYFTVVLWIISYFAGSNGGNRSEFFKTHLNQSLILHIISIIAGWLLSSWAEGVVGVIVLVLAIMGIVYAAQGRNKELPGIGQLRIIK